MSTEDFGIRASFRQRLGRPSVDIRERLSRRRTSGFVRARFSLLAGLADAAVIFISAVLAGLTYHGLVFSDATLATSFLEIASFTALLFVLCNVLRHEYDLSSFLTFSGHARRAFLVWNIAFFTGLLFIFITARAADFSRGAMVVFYGLGFIAVVVCRAATVDLVKSNAISGNVAAVRVVLVGPEAEIEEFTERYTPWRFGLDIVASFVLRGPDTLKEDLALAAASARVLKPDDIYILLPWTQTETIDACVAALVKVPASIHLGPQPILDRFSRVSISRTGNIYSLNLVRSPLTLIDVALKRGFDLALGIPMLVALSPLLLITAIAIKLDSPGPVFFRQRRYGFNQEAFRILKFRSMRVLEEGRSVRQATRDDPRVTRIGRFIRRSNIDELPQLLNVIRGDMSLVGPRPHPLNMDQLYQRSIAEYARRHNVKPGITGWAQVHGLRGETASEDIMRQRIEHDLYYIDNWTLSLDIRILLTTLVSLRAYKNAF